MNPQFKKFYDQIIGEEEKARESIQNALEEKYVIFFIYFNIIYFYRKQNEIQRKLQTKKELEDYENELKKDLEEKKGVVDQEQMDLQKREEESAQELEDIKNMVESKKDNIIEYIINNVMNVNMEFPEMVKKRFVKKKKGKK